MRRSPAWMVVWSLATASYAQVDEAPAEARAPNGGAAPSASKPNGNGLRLVLPPVAWNGRVGFDFIYDRTDGMPTRDYRSITVGIGAATYLYAPWAATVSGNLNFTKGVTEYSDADSRTENNEFATGDLQLSLFPRSRFPTDLRYSVSDTRLDSTIGAGSNYRSTTVSLNQLYSPVDRTFTLAGSYERRAQEGQWFGRDTQDYYLLDYASAWKRQQLSANLTRNRNRAEATGEETDFFSVFARHSYYPVDALTIDSGASWTHSDDQLRTGDRTATAIQLASVAVWNSLTMPLTVTGSVRAMSFQQERSNDSRTVVAGVGANYDINPNARVGGSVTLSRFNDQTTLTTVGQINGSYQGDTRKLGPVDWTWYAGAGLGMQRFESRFDASLSGQLGHSLSRTWAIAGSNWTASLGQSFGAALEHRSFQLDLPRLEDLLQRERLSRAVTNTLSFNWSRPIEAGSAMVALWLADARQLDREESRFQQANLQVTGTYALDRFRRWSADFSAQYTKQSQLEILRGAGLPHIGTVSSDSQTASGQIAWYHDRMFGVPRLNFSSTLRVTSTGQTQSEQLVPLPDRDLATWENRLDYRVGRLDTSVILRVSRVDERQQALAMWRVYRTF